MIGKPVGVPAGVRRVHAQPDDQPVSFPLPRCCYADWLTEELIRATVTGETT